MEKQWKRFSTMAVVSALTLTVFVGCGGKDNAQNGDTVPWGVNFEQSGIAVTYGTSNVEGIKLAVDEINHAGGILIDGVFKKITLDIKDNKTDETEMPQVYNTLVENGNVVILGPATSSLTKQAFAMSYERQIPTLSASATDDSVTYQADKQTVQPYGFKICYSDSFQGKALAQVAIDKGYQRVVVFADNSSDYSKGLVNVFTKTYHAMNGEVVALENYQKGDKEFTSILTKIKDLDYDALFVSGYYEEASQIIKQARGMGIEKPILGPDGFDSPKLLEVVGAKALHDVSFTTHFSVKEKDEKIDAFLKAYQKTYGKEPDTFAALGYDLAYFVKAAMEKANSLNPEKIRNAIENYQDFVGVTGTFSMDENHTPIKQIKLVTLKDGKHETVENVKITK